jgi:hypothetical protein
MKVLLLTPPYVSGFVRNARARYTVNRRVMINGECEIL